MDWADDIAYAVHDLEDFYRAGLVPLHLLARYEDERDRFLDRIRPALQKRAEREECGVSTLEEVFHQLLETLPIEEAYEGTGRQRAALRTCTGNLIRQYVFGIKVGEAMEDGARPVQVEKRYRHEIFLLKRITWHYVIANPRLATQQYGKAKIIEDLFDVLMEAATGTSKVWLDILPTRCREEIELFEQAGEEVPVARLVADVISSLSDHEALVLNRRFVGTEPGSALDYLAS